MPVAQTTAIYMLTPLMATLLAMLFLGEHVNRLHWLLVVGQLCWRHAGDSAGRCRSRLGCPVPVLGHAHLCRVQVLTSRLTRTEDAMATRMFSGWVGMAVATALLPWVWQPLPELDIWALLWLAGLTGTVGHFLLIQACTQASTGTLAPYMYMQIAVAMLAGWLMVR